MAKNRHLDPAWVANPLLSEVREALREVEHIHAALKDLEAAASIPMRPCFVNLRFRATLMTGRFRQWLASLNETHVAMVYLSTNPMAINRGVEASWYLTSELNKADRRWNNDFSRVKAEKFKKMHEAHVKAVVEKKPTAAEQQAEDRRKKAELDYWRSHERARKALRSITEVWLEDDTDVRPET